MPTKRAQRGFSLVEMVIAIVVMGVGLVGVLTAYNTAVRGSADPVLHKQMLAVAEEMLEEVSLKPWLAGSGTITGCNRENADDMFDYYGYNQPVCAIDGMAVPALVGYRVEVKIEPATGGMATAPNGARRIDVTVSRGGESLLLTGWRTNYGAP